jgi:benzodiazapine receptor
VLWAAIATTAALAARVRPVAGTMLLPYLAWTSFAAALNVEVWRLNRDARRD